ncbi:MAG: VWA domain-containing protein [Akkermansia sp.]|nr:VWA domain-containing protein [Akkermansia sp.]
MSLFSSISLAATQTGVPEATREFVLQEPGWLWALLLLPPLLLLRRFPGTATGISHPTIRFIAEQLRRPARLAGHIGPICLSLGIASLLVALARPCWCNSYQEQKVSGIDIMLCCDLSGSMAERDMVFTTRDEQNRRRRITVDRLTASQRVIKEFIDARPNDRIGLVAFAGKARLCSPLTLDHSMINDVIDQFYVIPESSHNQGNASTRSGYIAQDGTAIGSAIASAATRLNERRETKSKVIILVTDGVNNSGTISPTDAARLAAELGIRIFTIAIGRDKQLSDYTAQVDLYDEPTLKEIARLTDGNFYRASSGAGLLQAFASIDRLEKTEATRRTFQSYDELFPWPLGIACVLLTLGCLLHFTRPRPAP